MSLHKPVADTFAYDPETGVVTWKVDFGRIKAGSEAGTIISSGHRKIQWGGDTILAHRIAWKLMTGEWPKHVIRHKNFDKSDNRWCNLEMRDPLRNRDSATRKPIPRQSNQRLLYGVTRTHLKAVDKTLFEARTLVNNEPVFLGRFESREKAEAAFMNATGQTVCPYAE